MKCTYPTCTSSAEWIPVIALPTIRTAGNGHDAKMVQTDEPTYVLFKEVCTKHRDSYGIEQCGLSIGEWSALRDAARDRGYSIAEPRLIDIRFKPIGWEPRGFELERNVVEDPEWNLGPDGNPKIREVPDGY